VPPPENYDIDGVSLRPLFEGKPFPERVIITDSQRVYTPIKWKSTSVMSGSWRLLSGGTLFNIKDDPAQKRDVAAQYPEVLQRLNKAYDAWWASIEPGFEAPTHVIVGTEHENPSALTSHDWRGKVQGVPWNQNHINSGKRSNGYWEADFAVDGRYEVALSRWPVEADKAIRDGSHSEATEMKLVLDGQELTKPIGPNDKRVTFTLDLKAGQKRIQGWILADDQEISGPYYCYIKKL